MRDWQKESQSIDQLIKSGDFVEARKKHKSLPIKDIPRDWAWILAEQCRRIGDFTRGLNILRPYLLNPKLHIKPNAHEVATYSALLIKIGVLEEAIERLEKLNPPTSKSLTFLAFAKITQWNYKEASPILKRVLKYRDLDHYQRTIIEVNLLACFVSLSQHQPGLSLAKKIKKNCEKNNWSLLLSNCLELEGQIYLDSDKHDLAQQKFQQSLQLISDKSDHRYQLFNKKWNTLLQLETDRDYPENFKRIQELRTQAWQFKHWETLRDCDFYEVKLTDDTTLKQRLYYATPYEPYRKKIQKNFKNSRFPPEQNILFSNGEDITQKRSILDWNLKKGEIYYQQKAFQLCGVTHKLLLALLQDMYKPLSMGGLFSILFKGEYFDPNSSPQRLSKAIQRSRAQLRQFQLPIKILSGGGFHRLHFTEGTQVRYVKNMKHLIETVDKVTLSPVERIRLKTLSLHFSEKSFSSAQGAEVLGLSQRNFQRFIKKLALLKLIKALGRGKNTRYRIN